jgi:O-methyltransferase
MSPEVLSSSGQPPAAATGTLWRKATLLPKYLRDAQGTPWDLAPRPHELVDLREYVRAVRLHRILLREGYTMTSSRRGRTLHRLAREVDRTGVRGSLVDCGVWNGGSTILLSDGAPLRETWAFDSFEGLPEPGEWDGSRAQGWARGCLGAEERLREGFARYGNAARLHVVKGWFEDTFAAHAPDVGPIAVLHCDGDWYESVLLTLRAFYPQVETGGYVVVDDYGYWPGARRATDEFRAQVGDDAPMQAADHSGYHWRKP